MRHAIEHLEKAVEPRRIAWAKPAEHAELDQEVRSSHG
jgi:nitroimidazol reductase NimA-like FMN-containing flavoprotein (pyridoxamine 5'-phosphate oxidase superfamily)